MSEVLDCRVVGELLALVAHDLRNPLSALHSNLGFLESLIPRDDRELAEAIEDGVVSCDGMNHIIANLDLLGQSLRGGLLGAPSVRVDVRELVLEVIAMSKQVAASHGVSLLMRPDSVAVEADLRRDLSVRSIANLVRNSVQHAGPAKQVSVGVRATDTLTVVTVEDDGTVLRDDTAELFTATGQLATKSSPDGRYSRGLGLYCARIAAEADGWTLRADRPEAEGRNVFVLERPGAL